MFVAHQVDRASRNVPQYVCKSVTVNFPALTAWIEDVQRGGAGDAQDVEVKAARRD